MLQQTCQDSLMQALRILFPTLQEFINTSVLEVLISCVGRGGRGGGVGVISGALLYIRDDFKVVDDSTILQVRFSSSLASANLLQLDFPPWNSYF